MWLQFPVLELEIPGNGRNDGENGDLLTLYFQASVIGAAGLVKVYEIWIFSAIYVIGAKNPLRLPFTVFVF